MALSWLGLFGLGLAAWFVSTLGAGGGAILLLPVAGFLLEPRDVPPVIAVASVVSSVQRTWLYRRHVVVGVFAANLPGLVAGSLLGAWFLRELEADWLGLVVGGFLVIYSAASLLGASLRLPPARPIHFGVASFVTASLSAVVGASGPLMNPVYLQADILKERMIGTKAVSTLAMQIAKLASFVALGVLRPELWGLGLAVGAGALLGNSLGKRALGRISGAAFARVVLWMLGASGGLMIWRVVATAASG